MGFKCGIVGLPNVGKSTLFNALTESDKAEAANYPFATIKPNVGRVSVPDNRLKKLSLISSSKKTIPTYMDFVDIAGLIKGASKGEGLGNKFLAHIREMDVIAHVVRCFENENITHINSKLNPIKDIETVETELILSDIDVLENKIINLQKIAKTGNKEIKSQLNLVNILLEKLSNFQPFNSKDWSVEQLKTIKSYNLIMNKPILYICNVDEKSVLNGNHFSKLVQKKNKKDNIKSILVSAAIESQISQLKNKEEKLEFIKESSLNEPTLNKMINIGYKLLNLITFFTSGPKETRAWTIKKNTIAQKAAGKIHSDFERGFIKAETITYDDFIQHNGEIGCRTVGKLRQEGRDYIVQDGDIFNFLFNI